MAFRSVVVLVLLGLWTVPPIIIGAETSTANGITGDEDFWALINTTVSSSPQEPTPPKVTLDLSSLGLTQLRAGFANSEHLTRLSLASNEIGVLPSGAFSGVPSLTYLDLSANRLESLDLLQFSGMKDLETLILDGNYLAVGYELDQDSIYRDHRTGFSSRDTFVWYDDNGSESLRRPALRYLEVTLNMELPALRSLQLRNNSIGRINHLRGLSSLTHLHLTDNALGLAGDHLDGIRTLPSLTHLYLERNRIPSFNFSRLDSLLSLTIDDNQITSICGHYCASLALCLKGGRRLQFLSASNNWITDVENDAFNDTGSLTHLLLPNNKISTVRKGTFDKLLHLQVLSLENNTLLSLSSASLTGLPNLAQLFLGRNQIKEVPKGSFDSLPALKRLDLDGNEISVVETEALSGLKTLEELSLASNGLRSLPSGWLPGGNVLSSLNLTGNLISDFGQVFLGNASSLSFLNLRDNPVNKISASLLRYLSENLTIVLGYTCPEPKPLPPECNYNQCRLKYRRLC